MSEAIDDPVRADFEKWAKENGINVAIHSDGQYFYSITDDYLKMWQAAHALYAPKWHPASEPPPDCGEGFSEQVTGKDKYGSRHLGNFIHKEDFLGYRHGNNFYSSSGFLYEIVEWTPIPPDADTEAK